jgi:LPXTG-motif cell wall-anchored protein
MLFRLISLFAGMIGVFGNSAGWDTCIDAANHGNWATGCTTTACTASPYTINVLNNGIPITSYTPYTNYTVVITSTSSFKGFILNTGVGALNSPFTAVSANYVNSGFLRLDPADRNVRKMTGCPNGLTQVSATAKRQVRAIWTSPSTSGLGPITFKSIVVVSQNGLNYVSSLVLPEAITQITISATPLFTNTITHSHTITSTHIPTTVTASFTPTITSTQSIQAVTSSVTPVAPTPVAPTPVAPTPVAPTPVMTESATPLITESVTPLGTLPPTITPIQSPSITSIPEVSSTASFTTIPEISSTASFTTIVIAITSTDAPSSSYNGSQYLRTSSSSGADSNTGVITGVVFAIAGLVLIGFGSAFVMKKKKAVSSRNITANISDYVTPNPVLPTQVTVSRFSLTNKTRKEFHPMQTIA